MPSIVKANDPSVAPSVLTKQTIIISADPTTGEIERTTPEAIAAVTSLFAELTTNAWGGDNRYKTLTANAALTLSGTNNGGVLHIYQDATGGRTLSINGTTLDINIAANSLTAIGYYRANGKYYLVEDKTIKEAGAVSGGTGNTTPAAPGVVADDSANTLSFTHALGTGEIEVSVNDGAYAAYAGPYAVGDVARAAGYYKARTKAATGRNVSAVSSSPAFTVAGGGVYYADFSSAEVTDAGAHLFVPTSNNSSYGHRGIDLIKKLPGTTDGSMEWQIVAANLGDGQYIAGLTRVGSLTSYNNLNIGVRPLLGSGLQIWYDSDNIVVSFPSLADGHWIRITTEKAALKAYIYVSTNGGSTWTLVYTRTGMAFGPDPLGDVWAAVDLHGTAGTGIKNTILNNFS